MARKTMRDSDFALLDKLVHQHGYTVASAKGRDRYATLLKRSDGKKVSMVAVRLLMPISSPYGRAVAALYRKDERKRAKSATKKAVRRV